MIIQSRRNLDKKIRKIQSRVKQRSKDNEKGGISTLESPCNKSLSDIREGKNRYLAIEKKKNSVVLQTRLKKEKNNENKEKVNERASKARADIKMQSAIDALYIKKREEVLLEQKKERVSHIKNSLKNIKHKRNSSNSALKENNISDYNTKLQKIAEFNKSAEESLKQLQIKEEMLVEKLKNSIEYKENIVKCLSERSYSVLISPRRLNFK